MTDAPDLTTRSRVELVAAYLETAFRMLDEGDIDVARAALRRCGQYLLDLNHDEPSA